MTAASRLLLSAVMAGFLTGCSWSVRPPLVNRDATTVYLADYGRHSSLMLPVYDCTFIEYAFGDWNWFALNRTGLLDGVRALTCSAGSTLGRRYVTQQEDLERMKRAIGAERLERLTVPSGRVTALKQKLDRAFVEHQRTQTFNPRIGLVFVKVGWPYSLLNTCNREVETWLKELGCDVRGFAVWSNFKMMSLPAADPNARAGHRDADVFRRTGESPPDTPAAPVPPRARPGMLAYHPRPPHSIFVR